MAFTDWLCAQIGHRRRQGAWTYNPTVGEWEWRCMCRQRVIASAKLSTVARTRWTNR